MREHSVRIITDRKEIEALISKCSISSVKKQAHKCLQSNSSLLEIYSKNFEYLQQTNSNLFFADVSAIMREEFNADVGDYWFLTSTLPSAPKKPVVYVILTKKNM